jgi:hypothetical protein
MKRAWKGALIGGVIGAIIGSMFNMNGTLLFNPPLQYSFSYNLIMFGESVILGILFGFLFAKFEKLKVLLSGFLGIIFSLFMIINSSENFTVGKYIFEKIIFYPFGTGLHTFAVLYSLILIVIQWAVVGLLIGYLIKRLKNEN